MKQTVFGLVGLLSLLLFSCGGEAIKETPPPERILHWTIDSEPKGAEVYFRIVSTTKEVRSTNRFFLGRTPYRETRALDIPGLSLENAKSVSVVIELEKEGYYEIKERFNALSLMSDVALSMKAKMPRKN